MELESTSIEGVAVVRCSGRLDTNTSAQTQDQLIADIAHGFDAVIMGADKWEQVNDVRYYGSTEAKDEAISRLPKVLVAYRDGSVAPEDHTIVTPEELRSVSSSKARAGERNLMAPHARKHWDE